MGVGQCSGVVKPCQTERCGVDFAPGSILKQQQTLQMLLVALAAFEDSSSPEDQGPAVITGQQRRAVDAALDPWMACLPCSKGVSLVVDGTDCIVFVKLSDPAELVLRQRDGVPGDDSEERFSLALMSAVVVGTRQIPPACGAEGCFTSRAGQCFLHFSNSSGSPRRLCVECEDPVAAASFGLTLRILQSIGPEALSSSAGKSHGDEKQSGKRPKPGALKLDHLSRLASQELSARLSSRGNSARGLPASARQQKLNVKHRRPSVNQSSSGDLSVPDSARSAPVQGVSSSSSTRIKKASKQKGGRRTSQEGARRMPGSGVPAYLEDSPGPEAAAGAPLVKPRSTVEIPESFSPNGHLQGSLLPQWYHKAMDDEEHDEAVPSLPTVAALPEESPEAQEVRAFLSGCGLVKHLGALLQNGFDSMEALQQAEDEHLEKVGLPLGHRLLIMRKFSQKACVLDDEETTIFDSLDMQRFRQGRKRTLDRSFRADDDILKAA